MREGIAAVTPNLRLQETNIRRGLDCRGSELLDED